MIEQHTGEAFFSGCLAGGFFGSSSGTSHSFSRDSRVVLGKRWYPLVFAGRDGGVNPMVIGAEKKRAEDRMPFEVIPEGAASGRVWAIVHLKDGRIATPRYRTRATAIATAKRWMVFRHKREPRVLHQQGRILIVD